MSMDFVRSPMAVHDLLDRIFLAHFYDAKLKFCIYFYSCFRSRILLDFREISFRFKGKGTFFFRYLRKIDPYQEKSDAISC